MNYHNSGITHVGSNPTAYLRAAVRRATVLNNDVLLSALAIILVLEINVFKTVLIFHCRSNKCSVSNPDN